MKFRLKAESFYDGRLKLLVDDKWCDVFGCYGVSAAMSNDKNKKIDLLGNLFFSKNIRPSIGGRKVKKFVLCNGEEICFQ